MTASQKGAWVPYFIPKEMEALGRGLACLWSHQKMELIVQHCGLCWQVVMPKGQVLFSLPPVPCPISQPRARTVGKYSLVREPECVHKCVCLRVPVHRSVHGAWFSDRQVISLLKWEHPVEASAWQMDRYLRFPLCWTRQSPSFFANCKKL